MTRYPESDCEKDWCWQNLWGHHILMFKSSFFFSFWNSHCSIISADFSFLITSWLTLAGSSLPTAVRLIRAASHHPSPGIHDFLRLWGDGQCPLQSVCTEMTLHRGAFLVSLGDGPRISSRVGEIGGLFLSLRRAWLGPWLSRSRLCFRSLGLYPTRLDNLSSFFQLKILD